MHSFDLAKLGAVGVALVALPGCSVFSGWMSCSTDVQANVASPDGSYVATTFHRACGATTGFNTQVSLRKASDAFDPKQSPILSLDGRHVLRTTWTDDKHLRIELPPDRVYKEQTRWDAVEIEYLRGK